MTNKKPSEETFTLMSEAQKDFVLMQWGKHQHDDFKVDFDVSGEKDYLKEFLVQRGVWDPFKASGRYHARYLFYNNHLFLNGTAIEIGSGTGLMGVIMAKHGANKVIMSDISPLAVENTQININRYGLENISSVVQGDLFENIKEKANMIIFNIPFFPGNPPKGDTISASMIMPPSLLERFLEESKDYLKKGGVVVVPSFSFGGDLTNPMIVGKRLGYDAKTTWTHNSINGLQRGLIYIHELRLKD